MDKLAKQLKQDAERIEVQVSDELDHRIAASLRGIRPELAQSPPPRRRPAFFWWASSLTGVAAAIVVIGVMNIQSRGDNTPSHTPQNPPTVAVTTPAIDWKAESAMLTSPLRQELEDLQSDLKKAEEKVKEDIGL